MADVEKIGSAYPMDRIRTEPEGIRQSSVEAQIEDKTVTAAIGPGYKKMGAATWRTSAVPNWNSHSTSEPERFDSVFPWLRGKGKGATPAPVHGFTDSALADFNISPPSRMSHHVSFSGEC